MDVVEFKLRRERHPPVGEWTVVDILVNGVRLQDMVRQAEAPFAAAAGDPELAGGYMGMDPSAVASGHFLGRPVTMAITGQPIRARVLLRCTCGEDGCWPLTAKVTLRDRDVTWADFRSAKPDWDIEVGPFRFDRGQYESALGKLATAQ